MTKRFNIQALMILLLMICGSGYLFAQGSPNVPLLVNVNPHPSAGYNEVWGYTAPDGREYALLGVRNGTSIIDITDTDNPSEINFIPSNSSLWKDIKTYQHYAYAVNESGGGLQIIDLSDLPNSAPLIATFNGFNTSHNIYIDEETGIMLAEGSFGSAVRVISLADPVNPVVISSFGVECHDIIYHDGIAYVSEGNQGSFGVYDLSDPSDPVFITQINVPSAGYAHNAWPTEDGQFLMTTEETGGKTIKMWDVSDPTNASITDQVLGPNGLAHNTHIKGNFAYVSHYSVGLRIYDITDKYDILDAGHYDTYPNGNGGGFDGAWGAYPFFRSGKVLISDQTTGLYVVYYAGAREGDDDDPNAPTDVAAYSDYNTPSEITLTWSDPTEFFGGDPLNAGDFTIEIERDGNLVGSIAGGTETFTDNGLTDGQLYSYEVYAKVIATDSTSEARSAEWHAGGSPVPAAPANLNCSPTVSDVTLTWEDPTTQSDGTPLDDLAEINVYRNGALINTVAAGTGSYVDSPPSGFSYDYHLTAVDSEVPANESAPGNTVNCYAGDVPDFLVWVGPDAVGPGAESGDSLFAALIANGESAFLTNDLFEFGGLDVYEGVFVVLGIFGDNHVLDSGAPEADALESYLQNGGRLYLEGGDCYNYDPDQGAYNIRPWFGVDDGPDGSGDVDGITGLNDLSAFSFAYNGADNWMDELQPNGSVAIWKNADNSDISGVFYDGFGSGNSIGVVPSFGGLVDNGSVPLREGTFSATAEMPAQPLTRETVKSRAAKQPRKPFVKKAAWYPELKEQRKPANELFKVTSRGVEIFANTKVDLMAAYLGMLGYTGGPRIWMNASNVSHTSQSGGNGNETVRIFNTGSASGDDLSFNIAANPAVAWLNIDPASGTLASGEWVDVVFSFDANGLSGGSYNTMLEISSNDANSPMVELPVELVVDAVAAIVLETGSVDFDTVFVGEQASAEFYVYNEGGATLEVTELSASHSAFTVNTSPFSVLAGDSQAVSVTFAPAEVGSFGAQLKIASNSQDSDTVTVELQGVGALVTGINGNTGLPEAFAVKPNYPNPFNPSTRIEFQLPEAATVSLDIYNMLGQKVRSLVNSQSLSAGYHIAEWDGRNSEGNWVGSGIYIYRISAGKFMQTRKMILMK